MPAALLTVVVVLAVYHLAIGALSLASPPRLARFARSFYGFELALDAQSVAMLRALGLYALFTGAVLCVALSDLVRYRPLLLCVAGLQLLRAVHRLTQSDALHQGLAVSAARNRFNAALLLLEAAILIAGGWASAA